MSEPLPPPPPAAPPPAAPTGAQSRLMITKMVLTNFKSYGGVREIGPFHKRFSSIVGPNGSGKSNVIDAMQFVFGERAKKLRLNKVSELIHKSETYPNLESASVSVHFAEMIDGEGDSYTVVPGSEVVVTRTAFKTNSSTYSVDGRSSTFTEVGALLRRKGIDLDNKRFLILQGEVEQIAMMKPKGSEHEDGLLEYLEDIIGCNKYVEPIAGKAAELEVACDARLEKVTRLKMAEKERESLAGAKKEAESFIKKEDDIRRLQSQSSQLKAFKAEKTISGIETEAAALAEQLAKEQAQQEGLIEAKRVAIEDVRGLQKAQREISAALAKAREEFGKFEKREIELREAIKAQKINSKKVESLIDATEAEIAEREETLERLEGRVPEMESELTTLEAKKGDLEVVVGDLRAECEKATVSAREALEVKRAALAPMRETVTSAQRDAEALEAETEVARSGAASAAKELESKRLELEKAKAREEAAQGEVDKLSSKTKDLEKRVAKLQVESKSKSEARQARRKELDAALGKLEEARAAAQSREDGSRPSSAAVRAVLKEAEKNNKGALAGAGVCGRLGDLGTIPAAYDVAVSTCCDMLDFIVVETSSGGQRCIEFLRKNQLGRASFVVLEELGQWKAKATAAAPKTPGNAKRLYDLVEQSDPKYATAFYMALRDTLVADDLDSAVKLAYQPNNVRWRTVTLVGQLIDTSGTMSGGGGKPKKGAMLLQGQKKGPAASSEGESASAQAAKNQAVVVLEEASQKAGAACEAAGRAAAETEDELDSAKRELASATSLEAPKLEAMLRTATATRSKLEERVANLAQKAEEQAEASQDEVADLEKRSKKARASLAKLQKDPKFSALQAQVTALQQSILDSETKELKSASKKLEAQKNAIEKIVTELSSALATRKSSTKALAKAQEKLLKAHAQLAQLEEAKAQTLEDHVELEKTSEKLTGERDAAAAAAEKHQETLSEKVNALADLTKKLTDAASAAVDLEAQRDDFQRALAKNRAALQHHTNDLNALKKVHAIEIKEFAEVLLRLLPKKQQPKEQEEGASPADMEDPLALEIFTPELLTDMDEKKMNMDLERLEKERETLSVDVKVIEQYRLKQRDYQLKLDDLEKVTDLRDRAREELESLKKRRLDEFMKGFSHITLKLKEMYQMITLGGDAELELVDSLDPFNEGIVFSVRPPKKSWKHIANLSGGEKTLSSLALVFALHHYKPTPLYVMDEIDAALDYKNVSIIANYIKDRCHTAQFVIISLRNNMFELADRLVGIYKTDNVTKTITIAPRDFAKKLAQPGPTNVLRETTNANAQEQEEAGH